jgi:hypothetical protein
LPARGGPKTAVVVTRESEEAGDEGELLLLVGLGELLAVGALLALGPVEHGVGADGKEDDGAPAATGDDDADPGDDLEHVVGAGDEAGAVALGDAPLGAAGGAQTGEVEVDDGVGDLAEEVDEDADEGGGGAVLGLCRGGPGGVDLPGAQESGQGPVVGRVLEDVAGGHGGGGELVDEEGLDLALEEVAGEEGEAEPLGLGHGLVAVGVEEGAQGEDGEVQDDGAGVLDDEDGAPGDLGAWREEVSLADMEGLIRRTSRTQILDEELAGGNNGGLGANLGLAVLQGLLGLGVEDSDAVVVANASLARNEDLDLLNGGLGRDIERGRELLDGLLGRWRKSM